MGAYVQQDDILIETMTPRECFFFAARMTSDLSPEKASINVENMLERLSIKACADTLIGGSLLKGISGGEKKRTSIGYELMRSPSLLLLDEPTSGLDS